MPDKFIEVIQSDQRWKFIKENKKVRKTEIDQENDQEKKKVLSWSRACYLPFFLDSYRFFSFFPDPPDREHVFFLFFS